MNQTAKDTPVAIEQRRLRMWLRMLRTTRSTEAQLREFLRDKFDTTLPRFDVLAALYRSPQGLKMSQLSKQLLVSNGNVTGIIERLVSDGLVVRVLVKGDRRAMLVRLTPQGHAQFSEMADGHKALVNSLFSALDHNDLDAMAGVFSQLKERE
jgi:DNA-binding MarR family transcriptional regulator